MAIVGTSALADSVKSLYNKKFQLAGLGMEYWDQVAKIKQVLNGEKGNVVEWDTFEDLDPVTTALGEVTDISPVAMVDTPTTLTLYEYGNAIQSTKFLRAVAFNDTEAAASELLGRNRTKTLDILARNAMLAGTNVMRPNNRTARTSLVAGSDDLTAEFIEDAVARCRFWQIPSHSDGLFHTIVPPGAVAMLRALGGFQAVSTYNDPANIYNAEQGTFAGVKWIETYMGKTYFSGGTTAQGATTMSASCAAGATTLSVTSGTGLSNGDFITIGTLDGSNAEQVLITSGGGTTTLTVTGMGNTQTNFGTRYAHASGEAVTEADQVYAIPLCGPETLAKAYSSMTGPKGVVGTSGPFDIGQRFKNIYWHAILGYTLASQKWMLRLEVTTSKKSIGVNEF